MKVRKVGTWKESIKRRTFVYVHLIYSVKCAQTDLKSEYKLNTYCIVSNLKHGNTFSYSYIWNIQGWTELNNGMVKSFTIKDRYNYLTYRIL